jgi:hypothetical protein
VETRPRMPEPVTLVAPLASVMVTSPLVLVA